MANPAQARALKNYRNRLSRRGMARFEVLGLESDRDLIRAVARRLAENDPGATEIRGSIRAKIAPQTSGRGGIYEALRRWPIADVKLTRPFTKGRKIDL